MADIEATIKGTFAPGDVPSSDLAALRKRFIPYAPERCSIMSETVEVERSANTPNGPVAMLFSYMVRVSVSQPE